MLMSDQNSGKGYNCYTCDSHCREVLTPNTCTITKPLKHVK